jgi:HlyD family secretion protein
VVIIEAENPELKLMPGLTATVTIVTNQAEDVMTVPLMAIRFQPDPDLFPELAETMNVNEMARPAAMARTKRAETVWIKSGDNIFSKEVKTGLSDGAIVEIREGVEPGQEVVLSAHKISRKNEGAGGTSGQSPFIPGGRAGRFR